MDQEQAITVAVLAAAFWLVMRGLAITYDLVRGVRSLARDIRLNRERRRVEREAERAVFAPQPDPNHRYAAEDQEQEAPIRALATNKLTLTETVLVDSGRIIEAIKSVRARTFFGLKEAKDLVDDYRYKRA